MGQSDSNFSQPLSPGKNLNLIPAITPVRNTKSYPLCHSTPMINTESEGKMFNLPTKKMVLVCSGLPLNNIKIVQQFAKIFNAEFQNHFNANVTHLIVQTDPKTKAGQKTFKYVQGVAYKKYVVSFSWVTDCLKENKLLNEDNEKYDVLDPDANVSGSKRSRLRIKDLFENFAFYCYESFSSFSLSDFQVKYLS